MNKFRTVMIFVIAALASSIVIVFFATSDSNSEGVTIIRFGHGQPETNERHTAVMHFKELVEEKSDGQIRVEVYPNEQLGNEAEMIESVSFNDLQMVAASAFSQYNQIISVFELPYLFESYEQAWETLDGEVGQEIAEPFLEDNLRIIAYFENGFRHITANRLVETPGDLKGLKIRTPEFPISVSTFSALGANPTPMAFGELYMGLQQGTVDAQENPVANTFASKFQEVQDYLILSQHQYMPLPVAISDDFWQSLTQEEQIIIEESAIEASQFHRELLRENEEKVIEELRQEGMEIIYPENEKFEEKVDSVYELFRKEVGDEIVDRVLEAAQ